MTWIGCCILVCATWAHPNIRKPSATAMASMTTSPPVVLGDRFQQLTAQRSPGSPVNGTAIACPEALKRAEDEAIAMEVLTKRHWVITWKVFQMIFSGEDREGRSSWSLIRSFSTSDNSLTNFGPTCASMLMQHGKHARSLRIGRILLGKFPDSTALEGEVNHWIRLQVTSWATTRCWPLSMTGPVP